MSEIYSSEFIDETKGRGVVYEYLSYVLKLPVTKDFLGLSKKYAKVFASLGAECGNDDIIMGAEILNEYAVKEENTKDIDALLEELNIQWTAIFLTGASNVPCSSSVAITGMEMDAPWERVMEFYAIRGFKKPADYTESTLHHFTKKIEQSHITRCRKIRECKQASKSHGERLERIFKQARIA